MDAKKNKVISMKWLSNIPSHIYLAKYYYNENKVHIICTCVKILIFLLLLSSTKQNPLLACTCPNGGHGLTVVGWKWIIIKLSVVILEVKKENLNV